MATALSYPTISGVSSPPYLSALSETANIQNTINFLYYGSTDSGTTPRTSLSTSSGIYGMLQQLQTQISSLQSGINVHENAKYATAATITGTYSAGTADNSATPGTGINAYITFTATGAQSIDGGANLILGDRVLVKDGTTIGAAGTTSSIANGIYVVQSDGVGGQATLTPTFSNGSATRVVLVRSTDANNSSAGDFAEGDFLYVADGSTNANKAFMLTATSATGGLPTGTIQIGTNAVTYNQFIGVGSYFIGSTKAAITTAPATGSPLDGLSTIGIQGGTSGTVTLNTVAVAGTNTITLPALTGTIAINPTTTIGDIIYASATGTPGTLSRLAGNTATQPSFLTSTGNGTANTSTSFTSSTGSGNVVLATSPTITTPTIDTINVAGSASTAALWNTTLTTGSISLGGALTTGVVNIATGTSFTSATGGQSAINIATGAHTATTKTINIGGAGVGGTLAVNIGSATGTSTTTVNGTFKVGASTLAAGVSGTVTLPSTAGTLALLGANTFTGTQTLVTGTTTVAPLRIGQSTQANLLATPLANAIEASVEGFYATVAHSPGPGRGLINARQMNFSQAAATSTGTSAASAFATGTLTNLEASKLYRFRALYLTSFTLSTNSSALQLVFSFGTAPTTLSYTFKTYAQTAGASPLVFGGRSTVATATTVTPTAAATAANNYFIEIEGYVGVSATSTTIIPQIVGTGASSSWSVNAGSWFEIEKLGTSAQTIIAGNWA